MTPRGAKDDLDLRLAGTWRREEQRFGRWTLRVGTERYEFLAEEETGKALIELLGAVPAVLERQEREIAALAHDVEAANRNREALPPSPAASKPTGTTAALADVPLDLIGTFTVSAQMKSAAKKDPLLALAVQVAKAVEPDASPLEQARLRAMAAAVSRGDLETFWAASTERSKKKLAGS